MKLHEALGVDLDLLNRRLIEVVETDSALPRPSVVADSIVQLIKAGGKRLRPIMVMVGGRFGQRQGREEHIIRLAVLMEYMHMASLVHDDVIDQANIRRNMPTLHRITDVPTAVHAANYMIVRAMEWASEAVDVDAGGVDEAERLNYTLRIAGMASMATQLCQGEYAQLENKFNFALTLDEYLEKTRQKTAFLMAACFQVGAEAAGAHPQVVEELAAFGDCLGMAFQIRDDILDYIEPDRKMGKPTGSDLRNGHITLPAYYALQDNRIGPCLRSLNEHSSPSDFDHAVRLIQESSAIERSWELYHTYVGQARQIIDRLSFHPSSRDLNILLDYFTQASKPQTAILQPQ